MNSETIEIYHPRGVSNLGQWDIGGLKLKVYGLVADNKKVDGPMVTWHSHSCDRRFCRVWWTRVTTMAWAL